MVLRKMYRSSFAAVTCFSLSLTSLQELMEGMDSDMGDGGGSGALEKLTTKLSTFLSDARSICSGRYLLSLIQLCHMDTQLASSTWVDLFPRLWSVLSDRHRQVQHGLISRLLSAFWLQKKPIYLHCWGVTLFSSDENLGSGLVAKVVVEFVFTV